MRKSFSKRSRWPLYYEVWFGDVMIDVGRDKAALEKKYGKTADNPNVIYKGIR